MAVIASNNRPLSETGFLIGFDAGHSSIGWAIAKEGPSPELMGTGTVLFPADDCLASKRRVFRRQRRHARSTRLRIERMKRLLLHLHILTRPELDQPGGAWPWKLAARVLKGGVLLTWPELWDVLRWYAHNRGYDGNRNWSKGADAAGPESAESEKNRKEDTKKEETARALLARHGCGSMAETVCSYLEIDPLADHHPAPKKYFKGSQAAFPRNIVETEVRVLLERHLGTLPEVDTLLISALLDHPGLERSPAVAALLAASDLRLPKRHQGGLLFGQLIPRFENRIISSCPITYDRVYRATLATTGDKKAAAARAKRDSKVPAKKSREFLLFRWAMLLANIRIGHAEAMRSLLPEERRLVHQEMIEKGHLTKKGLKEAVLRATGAVRHNLAETFLHPDSEKALILRPKKEDLPPGRAPYARPILLQAVREVFAGKHPAEEGGCLERTGAVRETERERELDQKTNNHLLRQRIVILRRLLKDLIATYAGGDSTLVRRITIEVNRDLVEYSSTSAKLMEQDLGLRLSEHKKVVEKLQEDLAGKHPITAGLIRKARIATDLGWTCPYTEKHFGAFDLAKGLVDKDHIIPRSLRPSDSLESLVITSPEVNRMKGNRTAIQFIKECGGQAVAGQPHLHIVSFAKYEELVKRLTTRGSHEQDQRRKKRRKDLLLLENYTEKEFVPRDLTQTSYLVRLAAQEITKEFPASSMPQVVSLPGSVTGTVRKAWKLEGCLAPSNPEVARLLKDAQAAKGTRNIKEALRGITHLHHALDACVLLYATHHLPNHGGLWELLVKRRSSDAENQLLVSNSLFARDSQGQARLRDLDEKTKQQVAARLAEKRVMQHIPAEMTGLNGLEENTRGLVRIEASFPVEAEGENQKKKVLMERRAVWSRAQGGPIPSLEGLQDVAVYLRKFSARDSKNQNHRTREETVEKNPRKLLGLVPGSALGKLQKIGGVRIIDTNYGVAVWPSGDTYQAQVIVWHKVWHQLKQIAGKTGRRPTVLRKGQLIFIPKAAGQSDYRGTWRIVSIKDNHSGLALDLVQPDAMRPKNKVPWAKINVNLQTLLKCGLQSAPQKLTGQSIAPPLKS